MQWRKIELTKTGPNHYQAVFLNETHRGEGDLEIMDDPEPDWIAVGKGLRLQYQCDIVINMPEGCDPPKICFCHGDKPWEEPKRGD